jgi:cytochrome c oxidase subunit 2
MKKPNKLIINVVLFILVVAIIHNIPATWFGDAPAEYALGFQDPATTMMDGVYLFNLSLLVVIFGIVALVSWLMFSIITNFVEFFANKKEHFTHSDTYEIVWTSVPTLILLSLSAPSFTLLYSLDEIANPELTLKIFGHQWYWSYEISDYVSCSSQEKSLKFASYMLTNEILLEKQVLGFFRVLETSKRVTLPAKTHIRLLITAVDVLHSWTIPSFGLKVDACPGRLNQTNLFIKRFGLFFGQCSEICGVNHGFMPIVVVAMPTNQYHLNLIDRLV